eukprot:TRINITY_DN34076_c0_g1_i1.p1 TRINITY_DN34076_c0_g1~~TRINITY_DN34076_c0_g1_i1.p1  ORF type:complete len:979 (+),score=268.86 TRINITY_DN34076_c0_g1_i1:181-3117(+)
MLGLGRNLLFAWLLFGEGLRVAASRREELFDLSLVSSGGGGAQGIPHLSLDSQVRSKRKAREKAPPDDPKAAASSLLEGERYDSELHAQQAERTLVNDSQADGDAALGRRPLSKMFRIVNREAAAYGFLAFVAFVVAVGIFSVWVMTAHTEHENHSVIAKDFVRSYKEGYKHDIEEACELYTLRFKDEERENAFATAHAEEVCNNSSILLVLIMAYAFFDIIIEKDQNFQRHLRSLHEFRSFTPAASVYVISLMMLIAASGGFLALLKLNPASKQSRFSEYCVVAWALMMVCVHTLFGQKFNVASLMNEDPRHAFTTYQFGGDYVLFYTAFFAYIAVWTRVRFCLLAPIGATISIVYPLSVLMLGTPDKELWAKYWGGDDKMNLGHSDVAKVDMVGVTSVVDNVGAFTMDRWLKLTIMTGMILVGQRYVEMSRRLSFISMQVTLEMIASLKGETDEKEVPKSNALEEANSCLVQVMQKARRLEKHPVLRTAGLAGEVERMKHLLKIVQKSLAHADSLFDVSAANVLQKAEFKEYKDEAFQRVLEDLQGRAAQDTAPRKESGAEDGQALPSRPRMSTEAIEVESLQVAEGVGEDWAFDPLAAARKTGNRALLFVAEMATIRAPWQGGLMRDKVTTDVMRSFLREVHCRYLPNAYHNEAHASAVTHIALWLARRTGLFDDGVATDLESMALMVAAICHDVGHFGRGTPFLVNSKHSAAMIWNDSSPLENMHAATVFSLCEMKDCAILGDLQGNERKSFRSQVLNLILATDLKYHQESLTKFTSRRQSDEFLLSPQNGGDAESWQADKAILAKQIMQCSDVAHAGTIWEQHREWSFRVVSEFLEQGDEELSLGLPVSPLADRASLNIVKGQGFFIDVISKPTFKELEAVALSEEGRTRLAEEVVKQCDMNKQSWHTHFSNGEFDAYTFKLEDMVTQADASEATKKMPYRWNEEGSSSMQRVATDQLLKEITAYRSLGTPGL